MRKESKLLGKQTMRTKKKKKKKPNNTKKILPIYFSTCKSKCHVIPYFGIKGQSMKERKQQMVREKKTTVRKSQGQ